MLMLYIVCSDMSLTSSLHGYGWLTVTFVVQGSSLPSSSQLDQDCAFQLEGSDHVKHAFNSLTLEDQLRCLQELSEVMLRMRASSCIVDLASACCVALCEVSYLLCITPAQASAQHSCCQFCIAGSAIAQSHDLKFCISPESHRAIVLYHTPMH